MSGTAVVVIIIAAVLFGGLAYFNYQREKKRREELFQFATARGWGFTVQDNSLCDQWSGAPFGLGDHRRSQNVMAGVEKGRSFTAWDYSYQTHSTDSEGHRSTTTHRFSICAVTLPAYLPELTVTPESVFSKIGHAMGFDDIELESDDFNRAYRVKARDRKFATDVLPPRTMELLLRNPRSCWRIDGASIVSWQQGEQSPSGVIASLSTLGGVVDGIPSFVWRDSGAAPAVTSSQRAPAAASAPAPAAAPAPATQPPAPEGTP